MEQKKIINSWNLHTFFSKKFEDLFPLAEENLNQTDLKTDPVLLENMPCQIICILSIIL
jgi:hypothetical protein